MQRYFAIGLGILSLTAMLGTYSIYSFIYDNATSDALSTSLSQIFSNITYTPHLLYYNDSGIVRYYLYFTINTGNLTIFLKDVDAIPNSTTFLNEVLNNNVTILFPINAVVHGFYWNVSEIRCEAENTAISFSYEENITKRFLQYQGIMTNLYGNITANLTNFVRNYENYTLTLFKLGYSEPQPIKEEEDVRVDYKGYEIDVSVLNNGNIPTFFKNITVYVNYTGSVKGQSKYVINVNKYFLPTNSSSYTIYLNLPNNGSYSSIAIYAILYYSDVIGQGEVYSNVIYLTAKAALDLYYSHGKVYVSAQNQGNLLLYLNRVELVATMVSINGSTTQKTYILNVSQTLQPGSLFSTNLTLPPGNYSSLSIEAILYYSSILGQGQAQDYCLLEVNPQMILSYFEGLLGITVQERGNVNLDLKYVKIIYVTQDNITNQTIINVNTTILPFTDYYVQAFIENATKITVILYYSDEIGQGELVKTIVV